MTWTWLSIQIRYGQRLLALPPLLTAILVVDLAAYVGGLLYWYGFVMAQPLTPIWAWPFIPDCPLFGLLGGLGLLSVTAQRFWSPSAQERTQRQLLLAGGLAAILALSTYLPGVAVGWVMQRSMIALLAASFLIGGFFLLRTPTWLLALIAAGQIKYGVWTITAWLIFWKNTAAELGSPLFTFDSVFMTVTHIGLVAQGIWLLTYFRPNWRDALVVVGWFGLSDYVDYGLGWYPSLPLRWIPLAWMQWSTIVVTGLLSGVFLWLSRQAAPLLDRNATTQPVHWVGR